MKPKILPIVLISIGLIGLITFAIIKSLPQEQNLGAGELWYPASNFLKPVVTTWGVYGIRASISDDLTIGSLTNCDTIDADASGTLSCGSDDSAAGAPVDHGLLSDWGHNDVSNASASAGALIYGSGTTWTPLAVGASQSFLMSNGTNPVWADYVDKDTTYTATEPLSLVGTAFDIDYASGTSGGYILGANYETLWGHQASVNAHIDWSGAGAGTIHTDNYIEGLTYTAGDHITLTVADFDVDDDFLLNTGDSGTWVSLSDNFLSAQGIITSLSATTLNFPADSVAEEDIDFNTACAAGSHFYLNGNDLACETDDNTTYTAVAPLFLTGTAFDIELASTGGDGYLSKADWDIFNGKWDGLTDMVLTDTYIYVGNGSNDPVGVQMTNDCSISNLGAITCDHDALTNFVANEHIDWTTTSSSFFTTGNLSVDGNASVSGTFEGSGLVDCDADAQTLAWDATNKVFSCGDDDTAAGVISAHNLLSDTHNDTTEASVSAGSLILGDADSWDELAISASGSFLMSNGTTALWNDLNVSAATITTLTATNLTIPNNSIAEADISFSTACAAGNHYYLNGDDLACEADDNTTYTFNNPLSLVGTAVSIDYASASGGGYLTADNWVDFNGKISSLSIDTFAELDAIVADAALIHNDLIDASSELLTIIDDETGTGHIVFDTSPQFETSFTTVGVFAINPGGALTIGDDGDTLYLNSSDWDISTTGVMTGIGAITADGLFTGTHASLSGDLDLVGDLNVTSVSAANFYGTLTGDLTCTDCLNATEIEDIYLLDDGDVGTGVYDFGGATSFEIPNGTTLTLNAEGQVGIDTTGGQVRFRSNSTDYNLMATESLGFSISSTSYDLSPIRLKKFNEPITITSINCVVSTATSIVFQLSEGDANGASGAVVDAEMSVTTSNVADDGALTNSAIDSGDWLLASMSQPSGEADVLSCTVEYFFTTQ